MSSFHWVFYVMCLIRTNYKLTTTKQEREIGRERELYLLAVFRNKNTSCEKSKNSHSRSSYSTRWRSESSSKALITPWYVRLSSCHQMLTSQSQSCFPKPTTQSPQSHCHSQSRRSAEIRRSLWTVLDREWRVERREGAGKLFGERLTLPSGNSKEDGQGTSQN